MVSIKKLQCQRHHAGDHHDADAQSNSFCEWSPGFGLLIVGMDVVWDSRHLIQSEMQLSANQWVPAEVMQNEMTEYLNELLTLQSIDLRASLMNFLWDYAR